MYRPPRAPGYLCSKTIKRTRTDGGGSLTWCVSYILVRSMFITLTRLISSMEPGTRMSFRLTGERGAILITKDRTYPKDIERAGLCQKYTKEYYSSWKAFAREVGHGDVNPVLVTGVDLTTQFSAMAYSGNRTEAVCEFRVDPPPRRRSFILTLVGVVAYAGVGSHKRWATTNPRSEVEFPPGFRSPRWACPMRFYPVLHSSQDPRIVSQVNQGGSRTAPAPEGGWWQ